MRPLLSGSRFILFLLGVSMLFISSLFFLWRPPSALNSAENGCMGTLVGDALSILLDTPFQPCTQTAAAEVFAVERVRRSFGIF